MPRPLIGVVLAASGRLAPLGVPLDFVARGLRWPVDVLVRDSASTAGGARTAALSLVDSGVRVVVTLGGSETLPAVAAACTEYEVPCVSTTLPWQVFAAGHRPGWAFHFAWGVDDIAAVFADLWEHVGPAVVGCLWNDGLQGEALRRWFRPVAAARGYELVDLPYRESGCELPDVTGLEVVTGAATAADLAAVLGRSRPRLVTCSRWLTYPFSVASHGLDGVGTIVSWTPDAHAGAGHDLAAAYEAATGSPWLQPLGLAHALMEVACHAVAGSGSRAGAAEVLASTRLRTMAGVLDWTAGPVPGVASVPLAGGQWRAGTRPELVVVDNRRAPAVPVGGELLTRVSPSRR